MESFSPILSRLGRARAQDLFPMDCGLSAEAGRTDQDDARHRVIVDALHVPPLANGALCFGQLGIAVPAAAFAGGADGFQRFVDVNGKLLGLV